MLNTPTEFPQEKSTFLLAAECGVLEVATMCAKNRGQSVAIICHPHPLFNGAMNNKVVTTIARAYQEIGVATVRFNFRGVGLSDGEYGEGLGEQQDLMVIIKWLKQAWPGHRLYLAGFSFGAFVAAAVARKIKPQHLLTIAPPVHHFQFDATPKISYPWLVIQGDKDEIVPFKRVQLWAGSAPVNFIVMHDVGHFFHGRLLELRQLLIEQLSLI